MQNPEEFYTQQLNSYKTQLGQLKSTLLWSSMFRLLVFVLGAYATYLVYPDAKYVSIAIIVTIITFLLLVSRHSNLVAKRNKVKQLIALNLIEIEVLNRNFSSLPTGEEYSDQNHFYSHDIDLFGQKSFFQYINRTALEDGKSKLANLLKSNTITSIEKRQNAVKDLAAKPQWRQDFSATASLVDIDVSTKTVTRWLKNYRSFVPKVMRWLPLVFGALSMSAMALYWFGAISGYVLGAWFVLGLGITGLYFKKVTALSNQASKIQTLFEQYYQLIQKIETANFSADMLKELQSNISTNHESASQILSKFSKILSALDQRNNMLFGALGNGFGLWDLLQSYRVERWISTHGHKVEAWFDVVTQIDAYNSLGNFSFNHQHYMYPQITQNDVLLEVDNAMHPLMNPDTAVANSFTIKNGHFLIITGANMAGKSTFLRTVSLLMVMSNCGLPVSASSCNYSPIKVITSMRTTDSLSDDESYFFSELKRLKYIVDAISKENYFIILDEILKGTNSTDKAIGSQKFIEKLNSTASTGIIATHDLSLCDVANNLPEVHNFYFDAEIIDNELHFDYTLKTGICKNMNASFLLRKMQIVDA